MRFLFRREAFFFLRCDFLGTSVPIRGKEEKNKKGRSGGNGLKAKRGRPPKDPVPARQLLKMKEWKKASPEKVSLSLSPVNVFLAHFSEISFSLLIC